MAITSIGRNQAVALLGVVALSLAAIFAYLHFRDHDDDDAETPTYSACVEDAATYLNSMLDIPMEQARGQARTSPQCEPLRPRSGAAAGRPYDATADSVEHRLFPDGTTREDYAGLYRQICDSTVAGGQPKWRSIERMKVTGYTEEEAEFLYQDATEDCG